MAAAPKVGFVGETGRDEARPGRARGGIIISEPEPRLARARAVVRDADEEAADDVEVEAAGAADNIGASYRLAKAMRAEGGALMAATLVGEVLRRCKSTVGCLLRCGEAVCNEI